MTRLLVVTGPPGAGKSTVAARAWRIGSNRACSSRVMRFFGFLARGAIAPWLPESNEQNETVTEAAAAAAGRFAVDYTAVYDGVIGPWFVPTFARASGLAALDYVILLPSEERCVERVRTRIDHEFSDEAATRKMHSEFVAAEIDPRHVLADLPDDPDEVADLVVASLDAGRLRYEPSPRR